MTESPKEAKASEVVLDAQRGSDGVYRTRTKLGTLMLWNDHRWSPGACQPSGLAPDYEAQAILRWITDEHIQTLPD